VEDYTRKRLDSDNSEKENCTGADERIITDQCLVDVNLKFCEAGLDRVAQITCVIDWGNGIETRLEVALDNLVQGENLTDCRNTLFGEI
jgi:hypothetical protein